MPVPRTTVCVIPRERFSAAVPALESLLADPQAPERLVYIDGGSPPKVRDELARLCRAHDATLLRTESYLVPNHARNLVFPHVDTEFTAFLDNDVFLSDGWIAGLEAAADDTGAAVVAPLYGAAVDDLAHTEVHLAGGQNRLTGEFGHRSQAMDFFHEGDDPDELLPSLSRSQTEQAEFHLYFARTSALASVWPLNEDLTSLMEHLDISLRIMDGGGTIWFEPTVRATYLKTAHFTLADRRFYLFRWCRRFNTESIAAFGAYWGVDPQDESNKVLATKIAYKRVPAYRPWRSPVGRIQAMRGKDSLPLPDHTIAPVVAWYERRRTARAGAPTVTNLASWDHAR